MEAGSVWASMLSDPAALEDAVLQQVSLREASGGVFKETLETLFEGRASKDTLLAALNRLLQASKVVVCQMHDQRLVFRLQTDQEAARLRGLDQEARWALQEIETSAERGISTKELKAKGNLQQQQLTKALKELETRKLVKTVKAVSARNNKIYMRFDLEPSTDLTGGSWYSEEDFDHELIAQVKDAAVRFMQSEAGGATAHQVHDNICRARLVKGKQLELEEVEQILHSLVYDARIEEVTEALVGGVTRYRAVHVPDGQFAAPAWCWLFLNDESVDPNGPVRLSASV